MDNYMDPIDDFVSRLELLAEELNDFSMRILSEAIESGETVRPTLEKQVSQARRAVEKAIQHLQKG
jgi:biotin operon repressor